MTKQQFDAAVNADIQRMIRRSQDVLNTSKPIYPDLKDKGKSDPYHRELTTAELEELAKLKAALDAENERKNAR